MTDNEINEQVARKLGHGDLFDWKPHCCPDYCHSIQAAWEVVDFMDHDLDLVRDTSSNYKTVWWANFGEDRHTALGGGSWIKADTAPMAICVAFLKLP